MRYNRVYTLVFLVTAFPPEVSGSAYFNWERARWFAQQEMYRVIVFAPDWQGRSRSLTTQSDLDNKLIIERYPSKPWLPYQLTHVPRFFAAAQINQKLDYYQPDLIVMTDVERFFLLSTWQLPGKDYAKKNQISYIAEYHTDVYNFAATYPGWQWLRNIIRTFHLTSYLYHQLDVTLCPSDATALSCQEVGIHNYDSVPFFGIDISSFHPNRRQRQWLEPWLSDRELNNQVIIFLGRLGFEKRVDLLIEAFALLKCRQHDCSLLVVGDGPEEVVNSLKQLAGKVSDIHFTGFLVGEEKTNLLASCDLFCSPSPYETFGLTVVEAMASGVPVIAVNSGGVSDYIIDGVNGYLAPPDDIEGLAICLEKVLLSRNLEDIRQRALQDAKQFSLENGCQKLSDYYQCLLN